MNKMPTDELAGFKADMKVAFIAAGILLIALLTWLRLPAPTTLVNEPCAPGLPTMAEGKRIGCTGDEAIVQGWYPGIEP